ncbi:MAG: hydantoinase/oxoprolinase family protein [Caldilineaceae bacterium]|nr:hydantoinase/oxoprolinase family protein [Caldilineaceae bacterium]
MAYRLGIDIGGTFTDATLINETTGEIHLAKVSSTPTDPATGFLAVTQRILSNQGVAPADVTFVVHGATVATNAIIEGKVARTGFVTTDGFRDLLEIARQIRPSLYDLRFEKPKPLVPRYLCFGVPERLDARGQVLLALDEAVVQAVGAQLHQEGVEAVAVCLLHAYANPIHEERVAALLQAQLPTIPISLSSAVAPEFREYTRASTTVINACIQPVVARYLSRIEEELRNEGITAELLLMQSSGGVFTFAEARHKPVFMVESGPAAGVIAAAYVGETLGYKEIISFDMGGTTAKAGLIQNRMPKVTKEYEVGAAAGAGVGAQRGKGYPIRTPVIDLVEIGAGGGSIAWVDAGGILRVGPQSAGADPGPVCYGKGGTEPTVTDANLVLGRLNPAYFLGGEIQLDVAAARQAIQERCADPLGMDLTAAAHGIVEIANAAMVNALRLVSVQRGYDPRDFALVGFGGAGPVHANRLAAEIEIPTVIIPPGPGVASALGLLVTDLQHEFATTLIAPVQRLDLAAVEASYQQMIGQGRQTLQREGIDESAMRFVRQVDLRYVGQSYELAVTLPDQPLREPVLAAVLATFHRTHDRAYGFSAPGEPVEFVNLRLLAIGQIVKPQLRTWAAATGAVDQAQKAIRPVYFADLGGYTDCPIYDRYRLGAGHVVVGPAIIEEFDATTVLLPGYEARVDPFGHLVMTRT